jgi:DNA-binding response OmpR family regulator
MMTPEKASEKGIKSFLTKPLTMRDLSNNIRSVLDQDENRVNNRMHLQRM